MNAVHESAALAPPVRSYLEALEIELKRCAGISPEEALCDAREFLQSSFESLTRAEPGLDDHAVYAHFVETFGKPENVAVFYAAINEPAKGNGAGYAPGWRISCTRCGRSAPAAEAGITRIGAASCHKYVVGWCRDCRWIRWMRISQDLDRPSLTAALGVSQTPEQVRHRLHQPWTVVFVITAIVALSIIATFRIVAMTTPFP